VVPVAHSRGDYHLSRVLDTVCSLRGKPRMIRADNGPKFTGKTIMMWAHRQGIELRLIEPGKPNLDAYVEASTAGCAMSA